MRLRLIKDLSGVGVIEVKEGDTIILAPKLSIFNMVPPRSPAFYNPAAKLNRDVSLKIYSAYANLKHSDLIFADTLSGVGARGLRVAKECSGIGGVYLNDLNPKAIELAKQAAVLNDIVDRCVFSTKDALLFLAEHSTPESRFDIVDVDPFGSPLPYLPASIRAVKRGGLVSLTATDTAVLCGVYPRIALRRYGGLSMRCEYGNEVGARLLLGAATKQAISINLSIDPVFAHASRHYIRVYFTLESSASKADENLKKIGHINHCSGCGYRESGEQKSLCPRCGAKMSSAGPLWLGGLHSKSILDSALRFKPNHLRPADKIVTLALDEYDLPPTYYIVDKVAERLNVATPSTKDIISFLKAKGFRAARTIFNPKGVRTDAQIKDVEEAVLGLK
jgi:tRNA (guanine26-N2/guanine27-N2)-dimethyltransferase